MGLDHSLWFYWGDKVNSAEWGRDKDLHRSVVVFVVLFTSRGFSLPFTVYGIFSRSEEFPDIFEGFVIEIIEFIGKRDFQSWTRFSGLIYPSVQLRSISCPRAFLNRIIFKLKDRLVRSPITGSISSRAFLPVDMCRNCLHWISTQSKHCSSR